jgi:hypothetical protein
MRIKKNVQCYCCEKIATTTEHVPPECFFPKKKYLPSGSRDYKKNLITVPSCSEHNNLKSKDDEYTAAVIVLNSESELAFSIFKTKWVQTLLRRDATLGKKIFSRAEPVKIISRKNHILIPYETLAISYEMNRIDHVIESIARGLYYYESACQKKWVKQCIIRSPNFLKKDLRRADDFYHLDRLNKTFIEGEKYGELDLSKKGHQPDVFFYQFLKAENGDTLIKMVFYGDFIFFAILTAKETTLNPILLRP